MSSPQSSPYRADVGPQLRARREELGMSQDELAAIVGGGRKAVGKAERGQSTIQLRKRAIWEEALHLRRGAISRAYRDGRELETLDAPEPLAPEPWSSIEWDLYQEALDEGLAEEHARERVNIFRTHVRGWPLRRDWTPPDAQARDRLA